MRASFFVFLLTFNTSARQSKPQTNSPPQAQPQSIHSRLFDAPQPDTIQRDAESTAESPAPSVTTYNALILPTHPPDGVTPANEAMPIMPKLTIGEVNDPYEQEADAVAQQVVQQLNSPSLAVQTQGYSEPAASPMPPLMQPSAESTGVTASSDGFIHQGSYASENNSQALLTGELMHAMPQNPADVQSKCVGDIAQTADATVIQRSPVDVWGLYEQSGITRVNNRKAKSILKNDFYSNWFLAQDYLLSPKKWPKVRSDITKEDAAAAKESMEDLMRKLLHLRQTETDELLRYLRDTELPKDDEFTGVSGKDLWLFWIYGYKEKLLKKAR